MHIAFLCGTWRQKPSVRVAFHALLIPQVEDCVLTLHRSVKQRDFHFELYFGLDCVCSTMIDFVFWASRTRIAMTVLFSKGALRWCNKRYLCVCSMLHTRQLCMCYLLAPRTCAVFFYLCVCSLLAPCAREFVLRCVWA